MKELLRVVRGGSWYSDPVTLRAAYRHFLFLPPADRCYLVGFRLVVRIEGE